MDAFWASVVGGLVVAIATVSAASLTGWWQREGIRITARATAKREWRQSRYDLYRDLLLVASQLARKSRSQSFGRMQGFEIQVSELAELNADVTIAANEVVLAGPPSITECAKRIRYLGVGLVVAGSMAEEGMDPMGDFLASINEFEAAISEFEERATDALEDDGSRDRGGPSS